MQPHISARAYCEEFFYAISPMVTNSTKSRVKAEKLAKDLAIISIERQIANFKELSEMADNLIKNSLSHKKKPKRWVRGARTAYEARKHTYKTFIDELSTMKYQIKTL